VYRPELNDAGELARLVSFKMKEAPASPATLATTEGPFGAGSPPKTVHRILLTHYPRARLLLLSSRLLHWYSTLSQNARVLCAPDLGGFDSFFWSALPYSLFIGKPILGFFQVYASKRVPSRSPFGILVAILWKG
jgi:hypothetical protein